MMNGPTACDSPGVPVPYTRSLIDLLFLSMIVVFRGIKAVTQIRSQPSLITRESQQITLCPPFMSVTHSIRVYPNLFLFGICWRTVFSSGSKLSSEKERLIQCGCIHGSPLGAVLFVPTVYIVYLLGCPSVAELGRHGIHAARGVRGRDRAWYRTYTRGDDKKTT